MQNSTLPGFLGYVLKSQHNTPTKRHINIKTDALKKMKNGFWSESSSLGELVSAYSWTAVVVVSERKITAFLNLFHCINITIKYSNNANQQLE